MKIDIHTHFIPSELISEIKKGKGIDDIEIIKVDGKDWVQHRQGGRYVLAREFFDFDAKLQHMDDLKLDVSLLSIAPTLLMYWLAEDTMDDFCKKSNDSLSKMVKQSKGRFYGIATVPLQNPLLAANELKRTVHELGFCGVQIGTTMERTPLDDVSFKPFFDSVANLDIPVIIHPYYVSKHERLGEYHFTNIIGNPFETCLAASRMIFSGFLDRYPSIKIVLPHGGGFLPYQIGRLDHGYRVRSEARNISSPPSSYLRRFYFDTITFMGLSINYLQDLVGADRVMLGTDIPFDMADIEFEKWITSAKSDEKSLEAIYSENAKQLFGLDKLLKT